jgi:HEPN domain-containing protein
MNAEWHLWLDYAEENGKVAQLCFKSGLFNACLQNAQQAVEKTLKALCLAAGLSVKKTHNVRELLADLRRGGINFDFVEEDIDLLDAIYLPSKYPLGSALPDFNPDSNMAHRCLELMAKICDEARKYIRGSESKIKNPPPQAGPLPPYADPIKAEKTEKSKIKS